MSQTFLLFLSLLPGLAQPQTPAGEARTVTKVVHVHSTNARSLAAVASGGSPVVVRADDPLKAIVLRGKQVDVTALESTIRELDSASSSPVSRNVELTVYLLQGSGSVSGTAVENITPAMAPVVKQLRAIFPYNNYQLLSTMLLRSSEGTPASTDGLLKPFGNAQGSVPSVYSVRYKAARVSPDGAGSSIHLTGFHFLLRVPMAQGMFDASIDSDVDIREAQKVVVGKSNIETADTALFVVLIAKLVP